MQLPAPQPLCWQGEVPLIDGKSVYNISSTVYEDKDRV